MQNSPRTPELAGLDALAGEWEMVAAIGPGPGMRARTSFEWIENGSFLVQRTDAAPGESTPAGSPLPTVLIIGLDDTAGTFSVLHADARDVFRVYQMTLGDGVWKVWRETPGFSQRFTGRFSEDRKTITCSWEKSFDGVEWEHDFDLTYTKIG